MGKKLIIKGVDYSANAISNEPVAAEWQEIELEQGSMLKEGIKNPNSNEEVNKRRLRSKDFVKVSGKYTLKLEPAFVFNVFRYSAPSEDAFVSQIGTWVSGESYSDTFDGYILFGTRWRN